MNLMKITAALAMGLISELALVGSATAQQRAAATPAGGAIEGRITKAELDTDRTAPGAPVKFLSELEVLKWAEVSPLGPNLDPVDHREGRPMEPRPEVRFMLYQDGQLIASQEFPGPYAKGKLLTHTFEAWAPRKPGRSCFELVAVRFGPEARLDSRRACLTIQEAGLAVRPGPEETGVVDDAGLRGAPSEQGRILQERKPPFRPGPPPPPQPGGLDPDVAQEAFVEAGYQALPILGLDLEARWPGVDGYEEWKSFYNENAPTPVSFRWKPNRTEFESSLGAARWYVRAHPNTSMPVLAEGSAPVPQPGQFSPPFTVDFRPIAGSKKPPLSYWVEVVGFKQARAGNRPEELTRSNTLRVNFSESEPTQFTDLPEYPSLWNAMKVAVELSSLTAYGGEDMEPYLLVAVVYLDGTTIKPELNLTANQIRFTNSSVRIAHSSQTHKNVTGNQSMSSGQTVTIPGGTGHFETTIRPIGLDVVTQNNIPIDHKKLRESTYVGILVIGLEEDEVPSTSTMNQLWAQSLADLQGTFDNVIRGFTLNATDLQNPAVVKQKLVEALDQALRPVADRLKDAAIAKTIDELAQYLVIPGFPLVAGLLAAVGAEDDYVGTGVKLIKYEELLNSFNVPFTLNLPGNVPTGETWYRIQGKAWITGASM